MVLPTIVIVDYGDITNIPLSSNAFANDNLASGSSSVGKWNNSNWRCFNCYRWKHNCKWVYSTAMGIFSQASGFAATAMGDSTEASGDYSTAMGYFTTASGTFSTATGLQTTASGYWSTAMGAETTASGDFFNNQEELQQAEDYLSFVIGVHNKTDETLTLIVFLIKIPLLSLVTVVMIVKATTLVLRRPFPTPLKFYLTALLPLQETSISTQMHV